MIHIRLAVAMCLCATLLACSTQQAYEGSARPATEVALIKGDPKFRLAPVATFIRSVDGVAMGDTQASVEVLPGEHELVVDCVVSSSGDRHRVHLQAVVEAGESYRLEPQMGSANQACVGVVMVSDH
ncbi:MAG: hypothetical protein OQK99_13990 [Gammaproteobacteria bacterium]|jgi:hypothetical protein|nr:hypothetical protein [Gammaproteobacteria bacterium]